jgi:hypothetical protein
MKHSTRMRVDGPSDMTTVENRDKALCRTFGATSRLLHNSERLLPKSLRTIEVSTGEL